jgi:FMN phosphatase YigB (HAD superfamily)
MPGYILFDLSEVLIAGLVGIEKVLAKELPLPEEAILPCFSGDGFIELLLGSISEDAYLRGIIVREGWDIPARRLKAVIRANFHNEVDGAVPLLTALADRYPLALLSDHAREWVAYIETIHPFMTAFQHTFFSFEHKSLKSDPETFLMVLDTMALSPENCLFIDDNPVNVAVAESVGIPGIRFESAGQLATELDKRGIDLHVRRK